MTQLDKKQLVVFTKKLRKALNKKQVFVANGVNDMDKESVAKFQLQPGWAATLELMGSWLATGSPLNHNCMARASSVWNILEEAESFLKIAGR